MKTLYKMYPSVLVAVIFGIAAFTAQAAIAKQTSLDVRIFEAYKKIDVRTTRHEENSVRIRERIVSISGQIEQLTREYHEIEEVTEGDASRERMEIRETQKILRLKKKRRAQKKRRVISQFLLVRRAKCSTNTPVSFKDRPVFCLI